MAIGRNEVITPEKAQYYLDNHVNYRDKNDDKIKCFSRQMLAGLWYVAQPIIFDDSGILVDGQNRLHAVIMSKIPIEFFVERGVDRKAIPTIDTGNKRTGRNVLHNEGLITDHERPRTSLLRMIQPGFIRNSIVIYQTDYPYLYPIFKESIDFMIECFPTTKRGMTRSGIVLAWGRAFLSCSSNRERLKIAANKFNNLDFNENDSALRLLAKYATCGHIRGCDLARADYKKASNALRLWLNNSNVDKLYDASEDPFPVPQNIVNQTKIVGLSMKGEK